MMGSLPQVTLQDEVVELEPLVDSAANGTGELSQQPEESEKQSKLWSFPYLGIICAVTSSLFFSLCSVIVKMLDEIHPIQLALLRFLGILLPTCPIIIYTKQAPFPKGKRLGLVLRGAMGTISLIMHFIAFRYLPLADASVIVFSAPVFVTIFARIFLKESCGIFHVFMIIFTLIGVVLIARPPFLFGGYTYDKKENIIGGTAAVTGVIFGASVYVIMRTLKTLHFSVILLNFSCIAVIITASVSFALDAFCFPTKMGHKVLAVALGAMSFAGQYLLTKALQLEQAGPVSISRTADVVFAFIWQFIFFHTVPDVLSIAGAILVTSCVLLIGVRKVVMGMPKDSKCRRACWILLK